MWIQLQNNKSLGYNRRNTVFNDYFFQESSDAESNAVAKRMKIFPKNDSDTSAFFAAEGTKTAAVVALIQQGGSDLERVNCAPTLIAVPAIAVAKTSFHAIKRNSSYLELFRRRWVCARVKIFWSTVNFFSFSRYTLLFDHGLSQYLSSRQNFDIYPPRYRHCAPKSEQAARINKNTLSVKLEGIIFCIWFLLIGCSVSALTLAVEFYFQTFNF